MQIVGIHSAGHDTGVCLWKDRRLVFAVESERLTRRRHESNVGSALAALEACPEFAPEEVEFVALSTPFRQSELRVKHHREACEAIGARALHFETSCELFGRSLPAVVVAHEASHAALAVHYAGYQQPTTVLVNEGHGYFSRNTMFTYRDGRLDLTDVDSLPWYGTGFGWSALGYVLGFGLGPSVAGKVMALSAFAANAESATEALLRVDPALPNLPTAARQREGDLLKQRAQAGESFEKQASLVSAFQELFCRSVEGAVRAHMRVHGTRNLALGGGCALNIIGNSHLQRALRVPLFIPPACNDAGQALGAAIYLQHFMRGEVPQPFSVYSNGYAQTREQRAAELERSGLKFRETDTRALAERLAEGHVVALFLGRAELGPRALGHRSIIGNPSLRGMKHRISCDIKGREWFRPLAPVMTDRAFHRAFAVEPLSPYMLFNHRAAGLGIPEAAHVDGTARIQTVTEESNPVLFQLLLEFERQTGVPALINTSLNAAGRPIANTVRDVLDDFLGSRIEHFVFDDLWIERQ